MDFLSHKLKKKTFTFNAYRKLNKWYIYMRPHFNVQNFHLYKRKIKENNSNFKITTIKNYLKNLL